MNIKLQLPKLTHLRPRITVVGVGGAGSNAVNNMIASGLTGVTFVVANTDAQSLANSAAEHRIQLGATLTEGLGAGAKPEIGKASAEEAIEEIRAQVAGSHMVFVAAGMGGGTGTGAAGVIARVARECGALTVGVVTKPFHFEGSRRMRAAEAGIAALKPEVDTLIVIPNQNLFRIANERTTFAEAFVLADQVLYSGIACVVDLIVKEGLINLDFADVRTIMSGMGTAMMGTGEASGERRAVVAAEEAISNPLLDDISLRGAKGLLVSITGGQDLKLYEVDEAAQRVRDEVDGEANIIVGATFDESLGDRIRVSIVASGMERQESAAGWQASAVQAAPPERLPQPAAVDTQPPFMEPYPDPTAALPPAPQPTPVTFPSPPPVPTFSPAPPLGQPYHAQMARQPEAMTGVQSAAPAHAEPAPLLSPMFGQLLPAHARQQPAPEFARALTEALEPRADGTNGYSAAPPAPAHPQPPSAGWASQSGAVFEDAPPQVAPVHDPLLSLSHAQAAREHQQDHGFQPQVPADTRRLQRRLTVVEEFPVVGQRDYHAKAGPYGVAPTHPQSPPSAQAEPPARPRPQPAPPRKPGFFERLMGARRRAAAESVKQTDYPQAESGGRGAQHQAPSEGRQHPPGAPRNGARRDAEPAELPAFFGGERK
jgi:cell division protein FtsZ